MMVADDGSIKKVVQADSQSFWEWWSKNPIQRPAHKEPLPLDGDVAMGGGSKSKAAKKPAKRKPTVWGWFEQ